MSERVSISADPRTVIGKQVKQLRREGWIPAVIYGQNDPIHIQLENLALRRAIREAGSTSLITINMGSSARTVLARHIQMHPTRGDLVHIDFYEVNMRQTITSEAALVITGQSALETEGQGSAMLMIHAVEIECLPDDLISELEVDLSQIKTPEDVIYVSDLVSPSGVTILTDSETMVAKFEFIQLEEEVEEEAEESFLDEDAEDVEVIGKGKQEDGDSEDAE